MKKEDEIIHFLHEVHNNKCVDPALFDLFSDHVVVSSLIGKRAKLESYRNMMENWITMFPDIKADNFNAERYNDTIIIKWDIKCTHLNKYQDVDNSENVIQKSPFLSLLTTVEPTHRQLRYPIEAAFVFKNNQVVRAFTEVDFDNLERQLGFRSQKEKLSDQFVLNRDVNYFVQKLREVHGDLSRREVECFCLALFGMQAKQIGPFLNISHRTVESHLEHVRMKLGCNYISDGYVMLHDEGVLHLWNELFLLLLDTCIAK